MTALDRAASLVHDATCRDNQHDGPESEYPCVELAREVLKAGQVESKVHRLKVERGDGLTSYPCAERVRGGWQCGVHFYPDSQVVKATPLAVQPAISTELATRFVSDLACDLDEAGDCFAHDFAVNQGEKCPMGQLKDALGLTVAGESDE